MRPGSICAAADGTAATTSAATLTLAVIRAQAIMVDLRSRFRAKHAARQWRRPGPPAGAPISRRATFYPLAHQVRHLQLIARPLPPASGAVREPGCGTGNYVCALEETRPGLRYVGLDLSGPMLHHARARRSP